MAKEYSEPTLTDEEIQEQRDWWHWLYDDEGNLKEKFVLAELHDFKFMMGETSRVYSEITGGQMSKPNYFAVDVMSQHESHVEELIQCAVNDAVKEALEMKDAGHTNEEILHEYPDPYERN